MATKTFHIMAVVLATFLLGACDNGSNILDVPRQEQEQEPEPEPEPVTFDYWPNPVSSTNGDQWLTENHKNIKLLKPKLLALSFGNTKPIGQIETLLNQVVNGFSESSRADGYENPLAPRQLEYEVVKLIDLRDGIDGRPAVGTEYPYQNSTLYPRPTGNPVGRLLDYSQFFSDDFAPNYGYPDPDAPGEFLALCDLIETGTINELWFIGSGDVPDAEAREVLESKQVYADDGTPITGSFNQCAGNGCFDVTVPVCGRSVRIGFVNESRGPGCYLHSQGHGIESFGRKKVIPSFSEWFVPFAGFDLDTRFGMPFESFYEAGCSYTNEDACLTYPTTSSITVQPDNSSSTTYDNYTPACGNVHFPPNAHRHYGSGQTTQVLSECDNFGRSENNVTQTTLVSNGSWNGNNSIAWDCSGEFLVWWFQHMPGYSSPRRLPNGEAMMSVWPFLFY